MPEIVGQAPSRLRFSVAPEASRLLRARERIRDYLTLHCADQKTINDVVLAIEEGCTNAIRHGGSAEDVEIHLAFEDDRLSISVKDRGHGFDVAAFDPEAVPDPLLDHGRGLFLMSKLCDEMELHLDGGVEVRLVKRGVAYCEAPALESGLGEVGGGSRFDRRTARTRAMLEEIDEAFFALDWEYRYVFANRAALRRTHATLEELLGHTPWELLPELRGSLLEERYREAMELARPSVFDRRSVEDGDWVEMRVYPTSAGISVYVREIGERKRIEEERERLLQTTALLLEAATAGATLTDPDELLGSLADLVLRSTDHSRVLLELWDDERQEVEIATARGTAATPAQRFEFDDVSEAIRQVITTRQTAVIDYAEIGLPGPLKQYLDAHAFLLLLVVPIIYREQLVGLIVVDQPGERRPFGQQEIDRVEAIAGQVGAAIANAQLMEREAKATRFAASTTWSRTTRLVHRLRPHPWGVLAGAIAIQSAILVGLSAQHNPRHVLGVPGSMIALISVVAGALAGPLVGVLVALAGGIVFYPTVAGSGSRSSLSTTFISTAIWVAAGLVSGLLARGLREQTERRRAGSVALARAEAAREAQLAEQVRIEELATGLQAQTDALAARADLGDALNAINAVVHSTSHFDDIMERALEQGVAALQADAGTITLVEADSWVVAHQRGLSAADVGLRLGAEQVPVASRVRESAQPFTVADLAADPDLNVGVPRERALRAALAVPLIVREEVMGSLAFWGRSPREFSETEVDFARQLGATIALAVDNARLYEEQRRIATTLQENFVHPWPTVEGLELGTVSLTAFEPELVGGDFSDVFVLDDAHVVVLIGDVAGKGVRAAGLTETVRSNVRAFSTVESSPAFVLGKTNELMLRFDADEPHVTAFLGVLDPRTGHLTYASAGHPAPVHLGAFSNRLLEVVSGPPLGTFASEYTNAFVTLTLEDCLVLYTDGVTEARQGRELFGERRLLDVVGGLRGRSAQELAEGVRSAALEFAGRLTDDLQIVTLRLA